MLPNQSKALNPALYNKYSLISLASLLKCPHFRSSRLELFCKKHALKNFAKLTGVYSGTGISCELCDILKNTFFAQNTSSGCF